MQTKEQKAAYMKGYLDANREKLAAAKKVWYVANRERLLAQQKVYDAAHPNECLASHHKYRAKSFKVKIGDGKVISAWIKGWKTEAPVACHYCKAVSPGTGMTIDHVIPMSAGGDHDLNNLVVCCKSCNSSKNDKLPAVWLSKINL